MEVFAISRHILYVQNQLKKPNLIPNPNINSPE